MKELQERIQKNFRLRWDSYPDTSCPPDTIYPPDTTCPPHTSCPLDTSYPPDTTCPPDTSYPTNKLVGRHHQDTSCPDGNS